MRRSPDWPAPGKLILFLHITARRSDGYHELQTLFRLIDHGDRLDFQIRDDGRIVATRPLPGVGENDLCLRAARLLQQHTGARHGAAITLHKRLPLGGGVGGGSSDAATVLVALNHLWGTGLDEDTLASLGLALGADVPVFVRGRTAWAGGIGERLRPVELPPAWYVVLKPDVNVSTAGVFSDPALKRDSPPITIATFLSQGGRNDCEPVVVRRHPVIGEALAWLGQHAPARLTGTGACVFAAFDDEDRARQVLAAAEGRWQGFVARGLDRSPLLDRLAQERTD